MASPRSVLEVPGWFLERAKRAKGTSGGLPPSAAARLGWLPWQPDRWDVPPSQGLRDLGGRNLGLRS